MDSFNSFVDNSATTSNNMSEISNTSEIASTAGQVGIVRAINANAYVGFNAEL